MTPPSFPAFPARARRAFRRTGFLLLLCGCSSLVAAETTMSLSGDLKIEKVADGLGFPEGPLWHPDGYLIFSDIHNATIERLLPEGGTATWWSEGKKTNGLALSSDGKSIYACAHSELELAAIDAQTKEYRVLASEPEGRKFNNVNDLVVDHRGNVFFTDPKWGKQEGVVQGVYRYSPDGNLSLAAKVDLQPNGIGLSPDRKWLYVARTGGNDIWRFGLRDDGELSTGTKWVDLGKGAGPDGMAVGRDGMVYQAQAGDGRVSVISPEGKILHRIPIFNRMATNCALVGENQKTLYVTGGGEGEKKSGAVYRVTLP